MSERIRAHVSIITGCLKPLSWRDRVEVLQKAAAELSVRITVDGMLRCCACEAAACGESCACGCHR